MAIDQAALLAKFQEESLDLLTQAEESLLRMESGEGGSHIDSVFRAIHTVKGNSGAFDMQRTQRLCHVFESVLSLVRAGKMQLNADLVDLFLTAVDLVRSLIRDGESVAEPSEEKTIQALKNLLPDASNGKGHESSAAPAQPRPESPAPAKKSSFKISVSSQTISFSVFSSNVLTF